MLCVALPKSIGKLTKLRKLMLSGNQLEELPEEMACCRELELLRIAVNNLQELPSWIFELPKLAWMAYSCNQFEAAFRAKPTSNKRNPINWTDLSIEKILGEGASGIVYKAKLGDTGEN